MTKPATGAATRGSGYKPVYCTECGQYLIDATSKTKTTEQFYDDSSIETCTWLEIHVGRHNLLPRPSSHPTWEFLSFKKPKADRDD